MVDAADFTVVDTIEPLGNDAVVVVDGELWTADEDFGLVQRFDGAAAPSWTAADER